MLRPSGDLVVITWRGHATTNDALSLCDVFKGFPYIRKDVFVHVQMHFSRVPKPNGALLEHRHDHMGFLCIPGARSVKAEIC